MLKMPMSHSNSEHMLQDFWSIIDNVCHEETTLVMKPEMSWDLHTHIHTKLQYLAKTIS